YNHVISLNSNKNSNSSQTNNKRLSPQTDNRYKKPQPNNLQYPRQTRHPYNKTHNINDINNWDEPSISTPQPTSKIRQMMR
ncbi:22422_t:CDS:1, partial [Rhizophagus irregularis]